MTKIKNKYSNNYNMDFQLGNTNLKCIELYTDLS